VKFHEFHSLAAQITAGHPPCVSFDKMNSSAAASPEVYMSAEELADEIQYQRVLLLSLEDTVPYREQAEAAIKAEIRNLEKQLKALRQGRYDTMASNSGNMSHTYEDDPFGPTVSHPTFSEQSTIHFHPPILSGLKIFIHPILLYQAPFSDVAQILPEISDKQSTDQRMAATSSTSSTPNSAASAWASNTFLSPPHSKLPTRKRSHAEHLGFGESENKYRRTSPSPHITRSTTPSTSSGQEYPSVEDGFLDLTAFVHTQISLSSIQVLIPYM
jgi:hypothetical protein